MATITNVKLTIVEDNRRKTVDVTVKGKVNFTSIEHCLMKNCPKSKWFKLKCELWGADGGLTFGDDKLYVIPHVKHYPDNNPSMSESFTFSDTFASEILNEDWGTDEIYAKLRLRNLYTNTEISRKSNVVTGSFG